MSFLTLSLPKEAASFLRPQRNSSAAGLIENVAGDGSAKNSARLRD
jgi:hypothetical protein